jgi:hypothetical protein
MIDPGAHILFAGAVTNGVTKFVAVPVRKGTIGVDLGWLDATSAATVTLELSSFPNAAANVTAAGAAWEWTPSGLTITGPVASAAGSVGINVENVRQQYARLKIVATANCSFDIRDGTAGLP